jgi:hypothetical protein
MSTSEAVTIVLVLASLAVVILEIALKDPGAFREIADGSEAFARRTPPAPVAARMRRAAYAAGATGAAAMVFLLA